MFSHAIPCQGGVTRAERERGRERGVSGRGVGGVQLESELVCWDGCDHAGDEGDEGGGGV